MIKEEQWYRLWESNPGHSKLVEWEQIAELLDFGLVELIEEESFYDSTFGAVTVSHYSFLDPDA